MEDHGNNTDIENLQGIEAGRGIDFDELEGKKTKIEGVKMVDIKSIYGDDGEKLPSGQSVMTKCIRVESEQLAEVEGKDGKVAIRASELFNLKKAKDGVWGFSLSPKSKLQQFMLKMKVKFPADLIGKTAVIRKRPKVQPDGSTVDYLGFVY